MNDENLGQGTERIENNLSPTLDQLKNEKLELENTLLGTIRSFTSKTGLKVTFVNIGLQEDTEGSIWYEFIKVEAAII